MKILATLFFLAAGAPLAAAQTNFDAFLGGLEQCKPSEAFTRFHQAIADRYRNDFSQRPRPAKIRQDVQVPIPDAVRAGVGRATPNNKGEYTEVAIPLDGTFRGLALRSLVVGLGNENGLNWVTVRFKASRGEVEQRFKATVEAANKAGQAAEVSYGVSLGEKGDAAVICNRSD